ncbi:hypothetical protein LUX33_30945 [Actinomadura madurae]|uniref:hypothetical protein n=1 Tax=Actinomadura madurae TaxID=1993 RepID=UPI0020D22EE4|nr:hypothetical protein [Actinomadura madurae]MCP9952420.1 hypothetical protein [Actinomadura madurae]
MIISGAVSTLAGASFLLQAGADDPSLGALAGLRLPRGRVLPHLRVPPVHRRPPQGMTTVPRRWARPEPAGPIGMGDRGACWEIGGEEPR